jgi:hypothetical protein
VYLRQGDGHRFRWWHYATTAAFVIWTVLELAPFGAGWRAIEGPWWRVGLLLTMPAVWIRLLPRGVSVRRGTAEHTGHDAAATDVTIGA